MSHSGLLVRWPTSTRSGSRQGRPESVSPGSTSRPFVASATARSKSGRGAASINSRADGGTEVAASAAGRAAAEGEGTGDPPGRRAYTVALYAPGPRGGSTMRALPSAAAVAEPIGRGTGSSAEETTTITCAPAAAPQA